MKTKKIVLVSVLLLLLLCVMCTTKSYGICFDMRIEGKEYVRVGDTINLKAFYFIGNDLGRPGIIDEEVVTDEAIWTSSDENVAIVEKGRVYGISRGFVTITAEYTDGNIIRNASVDVCVYSVMDDYEQNNIIYITPDDSIEYNPYEEVEYDYEDSNFSTINYAEEENEVYQNYSEENKIEENNIIEDEIIIDEKSPVVFIDFFGFFRNMFRFDMY